jgi:hypothetical protein
VNRQQRSIVPSRERYKLPHSQRHSIDFMERFAKQGDSWLAGHPQPLIELNPDAIADQLRATLNSCHRKETLS